MAPFGVAEKDPGYESVDLEELTPAVDVQADYEVAVSHRLRDHDTQGAAAATAHTTAIADFVTGEQRAPFLEDVHRAAAQIKPTFASA